VGVMGRKGAIAAVVIGLVVAGGCGNDSEAGSGTTTSESTRADLTYIALGDDWPAGAHCTGCVPFPQLHAHALQADTGRTVDLKNLATLGGGMASLLDAVQTDEAFRSEVASGDIIVISTGPNEGEAVIDAVAAGTCGGADNFECVRELGQSWTEELDAILDEIEQLRAGKPTAVRLVNAANAFIGSTLPGLDKATTAALSKLFFEELTAAMCENASAHGAKCLDVRPILNGPSLEQPVDDESIESTHAVADALTQMGIPELE
jgi:hypothetical protein